MAISTGTKTVLDSSGATVTVKTLVDSSDSTTSPAHAIIHGTSGNIVKATNPLPITWGAPASFVSDSLTRPSDIAGYAVGDTIANSTAAGSVVARTISVASAADVGGNLNRCLIKSSRTTTPTNLIFRIHLFYTLPTFAGGDNAAFITSVTGDGYVGSFTTQYMQQFSNCCIGVGAPTEGSNIPYIPVSGQDYLYWVPEALGAFTPISGEVFTLIIPK